MAARSLAVREGRNRPQERSPEPGSSRVSTRSTSSGLFVELHDLPLHDRSNHPARSPQGVCGARASAHSQGLQDESRNDTPARVGGEVKRSGLDLRRDLANPALGRGAELTLFKLPPVGRESGRQILDLRVGQTVIHESRLESLPVNIEALDYVRDVSGRDDV
jgi:hypothetical protein